jgi:hypothetical protein
MWTWWDVLILKKKDSNYVYLIGSDMQSQILHEINEKANKIL